MPDGALAIENGGAVSNSNGYIGRESGSTGAVTVNGADSTWTSSNNLYVGASGNGINIAAREAAAFRGVQVDRSPDERPSEMAARQPSHCSRTPTASETFHVDSLGRQPHPETVPLVPNSIFTDTVGDPHRISPRLPDRAGEQPTHSLRPGHHPTRRCTGELLRPAAG